jgi:hypothetical protein
MEMVRPHIEKTTRYYNQTGFALEHAGYEKKEEGQRIHGKYT